MKLKAKINFTTKQNHPDAKNYKGEFSDTYIFDDNYHDIESAKSYIKNDLKLVAGGGYRKDTIKDVKISITKA